MRNLLASRSNIIAAGQAISGVADREQTLHVTCGRVWITIEGDSQDYWLCAGESLQIAPSRLVVIEADRVDSRVDLPALAKKPSFTTAIAALWPNARHAAGIKNALHV